MELESNLIADCLVRWSARLFVACYIARIAIDLAGGRDRSSQQIARLIWTLGCIVCLIHILLSFHLVHHWSHADAFEHVRKRTQEMTDLSSGFGLYVNFGFLLIWMLDTCFWWRSLTWPEHRRIYGGIQGLFAFLITQATMVFGPRFWIPVGIAIMAGLVWLQRRSPLGHAIVTTRSVCEPVRD